MELMNEYAILYVPENAMEQVASALCFHLLGQQPFPRMLFTVLLQAFLAPLHNLYPFKDGSLR